MGYYSKVFSVVKNTAEETPATTTLQVGAGVIHQVSVFIPAGHAGLTGVALDAGLHQFAPTNQNEWFKGDDVHFSYQEHLPLPEGTREITIRGYNIDTLYNHSFIVAVGVLPASVLQSAERMQELLAAVQSLQEQLRTLFAIPAGTSEG